jgi:hypothetical protein
MINFIEWTTISLFMFGIASKKFIIFLALISLAIVTGMIGYQLGAWRK